MSFWGANEVFLYLRFLFCLPKSFFFWGRQPPFLPRNPRFCPPGVAPHGLGFNQRATCAPSLHAVQCGSCARGIAQPPVLRHFLWGISIVSLAPHSLGHPSLRIPSAGWEECCIVSSPAIRPGNLYLPLVIRWKGGHHMKSRSAPPKEACPAPLPPLTYHRVNPAASKNIFIKGNLLLRCFPARSSCSVFTS